MIRWDMTKFVTLNHIFFVDNVLKKDLPYCNFAEAQTITFHDPKQRAV